MEGKLFSLQESEDFLIMLSPVSCQHQTTTLLISNDDRSMLLSIGLLTESNEDLCFSYSVDLLTLMRNYVFFIQLIMTYWIKWEPLLLLFSWHTEFNIDLCFSHLVDILNQMRTFASFIWLTYWIKWELLLLFF